MPALGGTGVGSHPQPTPASSTTGSEVSTPASAASAAIAVRAAFWGIVVPPSQRFTVANETPSRSASCCWVRSSLVRIARSVEGMTLRSARSAMFAL